MELRLAQDVPFDVLTEALRTKFREASRFFRGAKMAVSFTGRVLNRTEEKAILEIISDEAGIDVVCIIDRDENNEMMYRSVVEQTLSDIRKEKGSSTGEHLQEGKFWNLMRASSYLAMLNRDPES